MRYLSSIRDQAGVPTYGTKATSGMSATEVSNKFATVIIKDVEASKAPFITALYVAFTVLCVPAPTIVACLGPKVSMIVGAVPYAGVLLSHLAIFCPAFSRNRGTHCWCLLRELSNKTAEATGCG